MKTLSTLLACMLMVLAAGCSESTPPQIRVDGAAMSLNTDINRRSISNFAIQNDGSSVYTWASNSLIEGDELKFESWGVINVLAVDGTVVQLQDPDANALVDPETPPQLSSAPDGTMFLAWSASNDSQSVWRSTGIRVASSKDGGRSWTTPVSASGAFGGYQNNHELHVGSDGSVWVAWLDSRLAPEGERAINVFVSRSDDGGRTFSDPVVVDEQPSCECCRVSIVTDEKGVAYVAWRKRLDGGIRDIVVAQSSDGGASWSAPKVVYPDNWVQGYCPDAGPSMLFDGSGRMHVAWWTGNEGAAGVKVVHSDDGGLTFSAPSVLTVSDVSRASHVQLAHNGDKTVVVVWDDGSLETPRVAVSASGNNGQSYSAPVHVGPENVVAAYPHVAFESDSELALLWNVRGDAEHQTSTETVGGVLWTDAENSASGPRLFLQKVSLD